MMRYMRRRDRVLWWFHVACPLPRRLRVRAAAAWVEAYMRWKADGYPE